MSGLRPQPDLRVLASSAGNLALRASQNAATPAPTSSTTAAARRPLNLMTRQDKRSATGATEVTAPLQRDPEHQRMVQDAEAERRERERQLDEAERPIAADLRAAGVQVNSVWDLGLYI